MQFEDPRSILEAAAAKPTRGIDAAALLKEGARQRRTRLAAMATGVAVVVIAASASFGALTNGSGDDRGPGPAAPSPDGRCEESRRASLYLREVVGAREARRLAAMLDSQLRELDAASGATYVSEREAYREMLEQSPDPEMSWELQPLEVPARIDLENADDSTVAEIEEALRAKIDTIEQRTNTTNRDGVCVEAVEGGPPIEPIPGPDVDLSRAGVEIDVRRAECMTGTARIDSGTVALSDGSKWCTFVLFVDNRSGRPLRLDLEDQWLWTTNGHAATPWVDAMFGDFSTGLFTSPIAPGTQRLGEVVFLLHPPNDVPAALDIRPRPGFAPISLPLEYDCAEDIREEPGGRCLFTPPTRPREVDQTTRRVEVELYHCGVDPLVVDGVEWVVPDPPLDSTSVPADFVGRGRFEQRSAVTAIYTDDSGEVIRFEAIEGWEPPPCA